ncbi:MAG: hypothetical protein ACRDUX_14275 [Mycobacterium sp.]
MHDHIAREAPVWIVEVNVLGRRFTHRVNDRLEVLRLTPRLAQWRPRKKCNPQAAA